jgi:hypothetical protein
MTLNNGFSASQDSKISKEDRSLIDEFIRTKGVNKLKYSGIDNAETSMASRERLAQARSDFRETQRNKKR